MSICLGSCTKTNPKNLDQEPSYCRNVSKRRTRGHAFSQSQQQVPMCPVRKTSFQTVYKTATNEIQFIFHCMVPCIFFFYCENDLNNSKVHHVTSYSKPNYLFRCHTPFSGPCIKYFMQHNFHWPLTFTRTINVYNQLIKLFTNVTSVRYFIQFIHNLHNFYQLHPCLLVWSLSILRSCSQCIPHYGTSYIT